MLDTGIELGADRCPELRSIRIHSGGGASPPTGDPEWHGTAVAAIIAADNDGVGINGIASRFLGNYLRLQVAGCYDMPVTTVLERVGRLLRANAVLNFSGNMDFLQIPPERRKKWAEGQRAWWSREMRQHPGSLLVVSAPNEQIKLTRDNLYPPAGIEEPNIITVGGLTSCPRGQMPSVLSAYGPGVDIYAPSNNIKTLKDGCALGIVSGTSAAVPQVASLAAILKSIHPTMTGADLKKAILWGTHGTGSVFFLDQAIIQALRELKDPVIAEVVDVPQDPKSSSVPEMLTMFLSAGEGLVGTALARICDKGMIHTIEDLGSVRLGMGQLGAFGHAPFLPMFTSGFFLWGQHFIGEVSENWGNWGVESTKLASEKFRLGEYALAEASGPETAQFEFFRVIPGLEDVSAKATSGTLIVHECRINTRLSGVYASSVTLLGEFKGTCTWVDDHSTGNGENRPKVCPCSGAFNLPFHPDIPLMGNAFPLPKEGEIPVVLLEPASLELLEYLEKNCEGGVPELLQR